MTGDHSPNKSHERLDTARRVLYIVLVGNTDYLLTLRITMIRRITKAIVQATADFWREAAELEARMAKEQQIQNLRMMARGR